MFFVKPLEGIMMDETLSFEDKQLVIVLYNQMIHKARCDMTEKEMSKLTGLDESKIKSQLIILREKKYLVGPNMA